MFVDFTEIVHGLLEPFEMDGQDSGRTEYEKLFGSVAEKKIRNQTLKKEKIQKEKNK